MRRLLVIAAALALLASAPAAADPNSDAVNAVAAFNPANEDTFERLDAVIDAEAANASVLRSALSSGDLNRRWAAAYMAHNLARTEADFRMLDRRLRDGDASVRAMVAFGLFGGGKKQAIPVLIALLRSRAEMRHSDPPHRLATLTHNRLKRLTGANLPLNQRSWQKWWREVRKTIRWDRTAHRYRWRRGKASGAAPRRAAARAPRPKARAADYSSGKVANEKLTIDINIDLVFENAVTFLQRQKIKNATENAAKVLNGNGRSGQCLDVEFKVHVKSRTATDPPNVGYHKIEVNEAQYVGHPGWRKSYVRRPKPGQEGRGRFYTQEVLDYGSALTAHELLHLMDFGDEYQRNKDGTTKHFDPENILDYGSEGDVLQRHLDELVNKFAKPEERDCQEFRVQFDPWRTQLFAHTIGSGNRRTHRIGELATASINTRFWLNPRTGKIKPAGEGRGGDSKLTMAQATKPSGASCDRIRMKPGRVQFHTVASGEAQGVTLRVKLAVGDQQQFEYVCNPPAKPASGTKSLISDGMKTAGAHDFTVDRAVIGAPTRRFFPIEGDHVGGGGNLVLTRLK